MSRAGGRTALAHASHQLHSLEQQPCCRSDGASSTSSTEGVLEIANAYSSSERYGGRPLIVLQIDRNMVGMDVICSKRGVQTFPAIQVWSRGQGETVKLGELEERLLSLGVASSTKAARADSEF